MWAVGQVTKIAPDSSVVPGEAAVRLGSNGEKGDWIHFLPDTVRDLQVGECVMIKCRLVLTSSKKWVYSGTEIQELSENFLTSRGLL